MNLKAKRLRSGKDGVKSWDIRFNGWHWGYGCPCGAFINPSVSVCGKCFRKVPFFIKLKSLMDNI